MNAFFRFGTALALLTALAGCAGSGPYRHANDAAISDAVQAECQDLYTATDAEIAAISTDFQASDDERTRFLADMHTQITDTAHHLRPCWDTAYEHHQNYDLYYAEFDDAGQGTDTARGANYAQSQLHLIESRIKAVLENDSSAGLNIVVFTHGWHGNARADNDYSTEFKAILQDIAARESKYADQVAASANHARKRHMRHRVLGIEIAWRGDSFLNPALPLVPDSENALNVWDRKLAAETLSTGSVQELLAYLNEIYLLNSCHGANAGPGCDRVHLLSIGHSFGALINFRALTPRLESGLNVPRCNRVFGFGDMTILLNPAFEGARYRGLFSNAKNRPALFGPYFGDGDCRGGSGSPDVPENSTSDDVQIPSIVTLQSLGDTATGTFFPLFRHVTTPFLQTLSDTEANDKNSAIGWVTDFRTHALTRAPGTGDGCVDQGETYCPFRPLSNVQSDRASTAPANHDRWLHLAREPGAATDGLPAYMPLWSVAVDPEIMRNHDDIWNPQIVRLISILFEDAYEQTERMHGRARP